MINFAIVGTSWITHSYVAAAHATGKWNLAVVYSRQEEKAREFAGQYGDRAITIYTHLDAVASDASISTVYIASPNILHYQHAKLFLAAGKNVIVEKPCCSTLAEFDDLVATAKQRDVLVLEAFRHIQEANFKLLKQQLPRLGPLYGARFTYAQYSSRYDRVLAGERPNIFSLDMGGGALADLGVYCISAAIHLFGVPTHAQYSSVVKVATGADGAGQLVLTYPSFTLHASHSKIYHSAAPSEIYGQNGTLSVPSITDIASITFWDANTRNLVPVQGVCQPPKRNLQPEAHHFASLITNRDPDALAELERLSREVVRVVEKVRKENGLLFPGET